MKIFLIRHGQSTTDVENRYGGDYDDHLTEKGFRQAEQLAKELKDRKIERIFSSPRLRALETAEILQRIVVCSMNPLEELRERNRYGPMTGMKKDEAKERYPDQVAMLRDNRSDLKGSEPYKDFRKRVLDALEKIEKSNYRTVAVVTHGGPIKLILREKLGREEQRDVADCGFFELEYKKGKLSVADESHAWA